MTVKLLDNETKALVDFEPGAVNAAVQSGRFGFPSDRGVPVRVEGKPAFVTPEYAAKYRDRLLFVSDEDVMRQRAEERFGGLGGAALGTAYGAVKGLSLGTIPAAAAALGAGEFVRDIELAQPTATLAGEGLSLVVDPFALAGRVGQRLAGKGAAAAAEAAAAQRAAVSPALRLGEAAAGAVVPPAQTAVRAAEQTLELGGQKAAMGGASQVMPTLGGAQALAPTAEEAARLAAEAAARREAIGRNAIERARAAATDEVEQIIEGQSLAYRPLTGPVSPAEPGLRLGADPFRTPELAMRARQAEELTTRAAGARAVQARAAEEAVAMERGLAPGQVGPIEDFAQMPSSAMESDFLRSELSRIDDALDANAAAARRARSQASRDRIGAERDRLLAERERLDIGAMRTGIQAEEDLAAQAGRAFEATEMQAAAPARALESERMGRMAGDIEAANVIPPSLRTAGTRAAENVSPSISFGERIAGIRGEMPPPNVSPAGIGALETPGLVSAPGALRLGPTGRMAETTIPAADRSLANLMAQGGTYGAAEEVRRQQTGESEGGLGAVVGAGLAGAAVPAALTLGGRALAGAGRAARGVMTTPSEGLVAKIKGGAETLEKTHVLRSFDISRDHVTRLNNKFDIPEAGEKGTSVFVNFIKGELNEVGKLKAAFPDDAILAGIPEGTSLKFGQLSPERKAALANAVERFYGQKYDTIFNDAVKSQMVDNALIENLLNRVRATDVRGLEGLGLQSVKPELEAMEKFLREGGQHSIGTLKELQSLVGENFRSRQGEGGSFTKAQSVLYSGLKSALYDAVDRVTPGAVNELRGTDMAYEMAKMLSEGAKKVVSKAATTSPIGRDLLAQFALGFAAIGHPIAAAKFFLATVGLRHLYNQRGEGIIADLAGKLSTKLTQNPQVAAQETADVIVNAARPMLLGASAAKFTDTKPDDYMAMSTAVRELQQTREDVKRRLMDATSTMPPAEQQKAVEYFDNQINILAQRLPKGIPTGKALSEQEKQYSIFARSVLDPHGYGVQTIVSGGPNASVAADAINSLGLQGQQFLQSLADDLQARISESTKLRGDEMALAVLRNVKTSTKKSVGGGTRLRAIHAPAMGKGVAGIGKAAPSAFANAAKAFSGTSSTIR